MPLVVHTAKHNLDGRPALRGRRGILLRRLSFFLSAIQVQVGRCLSVARGEMVLPVSMKQARGS